MDDLTQKLAALHQQWPTVEAITLTAENSIEYDDVIKVMDTTRKTIPVVLLGGF
jgi:biopolymer transport protein ExbD